jgi:hypothetical protein
MKKKLSLSLEETDLQQLRSEAAEVGMTISEYVVYLQEFYKLRHLHHIIRQLRRARNSGFSHIQMAQLSGLLTYLQHLKEAIAFR